MIETELLHYGYLFILLGVIVEGDATLVTASFLAHRGYFSLSLVLLITILVTFVANHVYYAAARRSGQRWLVNRRDARIERIIVWSRNRGGLLLLASRFMIGFRILVPVVCGATGMKPASFVLWNALGAVIWAGVFAIAGYVGGEVLTLLMDDLRRHEKLVAGVLAVTIAGTILWRTHGRELFDAWSLRRATRR